MTLNEDAAHPICAPPGGRGMWRAAAWTGGLFGAGVAVSHAFPAPWFEPVILVVLGTAMLFVSRGAARPRRTRTAAAKQAAA